nr:MAG TPA: hypothetical protein [Caudoviricetes sp.]
MLDIVPGTACHGLTACNAIIIFLGIANGLFYGL